MSTVHSLERDNFRDDRQSAIVGHSGGPARGNQAPSELILKHFILDKSYAPTECNHGPHHREKFIDVPQRFAIYEHQFLYNHDPLIRLRDLKNEVTVLEATMGNYKVIYDGAKNRQYKMVIYGVVDTVVEVPSNTVMAGRAITKIPVKKDQSAILTFTVSFEDLRLVVLEVDRLEATIQRLNDVENHTNIHHEEINELFEQINALKSKDTNLDNKDKELTERTDDIDTRLISEVSRLDGRVDGVDKRVHSAFSKIGTLTTELAEEVSAREEGDSELQKTLDTTNEKLSGLVGTGYSTNRAGSVSGVLSTVRNQLNGTQDSQIGTAGSTYTTTTSISGILRDAVSGIESISGLLNGNGVDSISGILKTTNTNIGELSNLSETTFTGSQRNSIVNAINKNASNIGNFTNFNDLDSNNSNLTNTDKQNLISSIIKTVKNIGNMGLSHGNWVGTDSSNITSAVQKTMEKIGTLNNLNTYFSNKNSIVEVLNQIFGANTAGSKDTSVGGLFGERLYRELYMLPVPGEPEQIPLVDEDGNPVLDVDGKPIMVPNAKPNPNGIVNKRLAQYQEAVDAKIDTLAGYLKDFSESPEEFVKVFEALKKLEKDLIELGSDELGKVLGDLGKRPEGTSTAFVQLTNLNNSLGVRDTSISGSTAYDQIKYIDGKLGNSTDASTGNTAFSNIKDLQERLGTVNTQISGLTAFEQISTINENNISTQQTLNDLKTAVEGSDSNSLDSRITQLRAELGSITDINPALGSTATAAVKRLEEILGATDNYGVRKELKDTIGVANSVQLDIANRIDGLLETLRTDVDANTDNRTNIETLIAKMEEQLLSLNTMIEILRFVTGELKDLPEYILELLPRMPGTTKPHITIENLFRTINERAVDIEGLTVISGERPATSEGKSPTELSAKLIFNSNSRVNGAENLREAIENIDLAAKNIEGVGVTSNVLDWTTSPTRRNGATNLRLAIEETDTAARNSEGINNSTNNGFSWATGTRVDAPESLRQAIEQIDASARAAEGPLASLNTHAKDNLVNALNELKANIGAAPNGILNVTGTNLIDIKLILENIILSLGTVNGIFPNTLNTNAKNTVLEALNEIVANLGASNGAVNFNPEVNAKLGSNASNVVNAVNAVEDLKQDKLGGTGNTSIIRGGATLGTVTYNTNGIQTSEIANSAITTVLINDKAITTAKLDDTLAGSIGSANTAVQTISGISGIVATRAAGSNDVSLDLSAGVLASLGKADSALQSFANAQLTGNATSETPADGDNSTRIATTAWVKANAPDISDQLGSIWDAIKAICTHDVQTETVNIAPTCVEQGTITMKCEKCGTEFTTHPEIVLSNHEWSDWNYDNGESWKEIDEPTCTETGREEREKSCLRDGCEEIETQTRTLPIIAHEYDSETGLCECGELNPSWCSEGNPNCIPNLSDFVEYVKDSDDEDQVPTCTDPGLGLYNCTNCEKTVAAIIPAAHEWDTDEDNWEPGPLPTCTTGNITFIPCIHCDVVETHNDGELNPDNHVYEVDEDGYCDACRP